MDFKVKIEEAQEKLATLKSDIAELVGIAEAENRDLADDEALQLEKMSADVEDIVKRIENLERAEKALGMKVVRAEAPRGDSPAIIQRRGYGRDRPKGDLIWKQATVAFLAHTERKSHEQIAMERYKHDDELQAVVKAVANPAMTDVAGWAQELTDDANQGFRDLLRGVSAAAQAFAVAGLNLNFDGLTAIKLPGRGGTTQDLAPSWTGEGDAIPVKKATTIAQTLYPYKWGVISTFSKELNMRSIPQIEALIRSFMLADAGTQLDANYFNDAAAVSGVRPAGILENATSTAADATGANQAEQMTIDLRNLVNPIITANMGQTLRIFMHPTNALAMSSVLTATGVYLFRDELAAGNLWGIPVIQSTNIATDTLIAQDCNELAVADDAPDFEVNDTATLVEYDDDSVTTPPGMTADTHPRSPNPGTVDAAINAVDAAAGKGPVRSLFQTYTVGIRMVQFLSWADLRTGSVSEITGVNYYA